MLNIISSSLLFSCNMEPFNGISTTFGPMYDFTKRIVKDKLDVRMNHMDLNQMILK